MFNAFSLFILFAVVIGSAAALAGISLWIGRRSLKDACLIPYECGIDPLQAPRHRFAVKFFLIATLFVIFDVEVVFLFPWAAVYRSMAESGLGIALFTELVIFLAIVVIGLAYAWRAGALEWEA